MSDDLDVVVHQSPTGGRDGRELGSCPVRGGCDAALPQLVGVEPSVDTVRDDGLARFEGQLPAVEVNVHDVWLERHEPRHAGHLGPCPDVGPGRTLLLPDVVVAGQALVRAERLSLDRRQGQTFCPYKGLASY